MNQSELIEKVAHATELNQAVAGQAVKAVVTAILDALVAGEEVRVSGLGIGSVRLTCLDQKEPEAGCAVTRLRLHSAIRSPPRPGRSAASIGRRDGVEG